MKMSEWLVLVGVIAVPLFACSSSTSSGTGGSAGSATGGHAGSVTGGSGGATGGSAGSATGGSAGSATGGSAGSATGGSGGATGGAGGATGGAGGSVMTQCQAAGYTDATCGTCMEANCATQCEACLTSQDCTNYLQCVQACSSDNTCATGCGTQYPAGLPLLDAWFSGSGCAGTSCSTPCNISPSFPICNSGLAVGDQACATCATNNCCTQATACVNSTDSDNNGTADCLDVLNCLQPCTDTTCENACLAKPGGDLLTAIDGCLSQSCATECGG